MGDYQREYYQAIDAEELALETCLRKKRNTQTAYAFLKRIRNSGAIMTDKAPSIPSDFKKLQF